MPVGLGTLRRRGGVLIPLFSIWRAGGWGIGEIGDIGSLAGWLREAGQNLLQLLPIHEMPPTETSPYSALSAFAIDPLFITLERMEDFNASGGEAGLDDGVRKTLAAIRARKREHPGVDYRAVRRVKEAAHRRAFAHFRQAESAHRTSRAAAFDRYIADQAWWLEDYALFRALHARFEERSWREWPPAFRDRDQIALAEARRELSEDVAYRQYLQWVAAEQWQQARRSLGSVALFGDLPFMVSGDSADVWARQHEFRLDASVGVPPDAFSTTGQDWKLPVYRWERIEAGGFQWLRARARRYAELYDGYRVDHLVGFYRTYFRPHDGGPPEFTPSTEPAQTQLGERVLDIFREPGVDITAEDLGLVPDFVRESLSRLGIPGYKVFRWERQWQVEGQPFIDPVDYPSCTVAASGTHDTETMAVWWEMASLEEREAICAVPSVRRALPDTGEASTLSQREAYPALLSALYESGSAILIVPIQDAFGWPDRINVPGTVGDANWTWALPWPLEALGREPVARAAAERLRTLSERFGR